MEGGAAHEMGQHSQAGEEDEVKAIILSAGQGRRLLPLTAKLPKCLVDVCGLPVLEWQLRVLAVAGVPRVTVVVGFGADEVQRRLVQICPAGVEVRTLFNPLYDRADNLISCLAARGEMTGDFLLINGDTLFEPAVVTRLRVSEALPVAIAVASKASYDADDMKVSCRADQVLRVGKDLPASQTDGEAIGLSLFRSNGPRLFCEALEQVAREPDAHRRWYLSAVAVLASQRLVHAVSVDSTSWTEIDYPHDLERAEVFVSHWDGGQGHASAALATGTSLAS
jgi:choline kinase